DHEPDLILKQIDAFDWRVEHQDKHVRENPAGYLVRAIQHDYALPAGYLPKAERRRREEEKRIAERQAAEDRRREREEAAREQADREMADRYWRSLSPEAQAKLQADILAAADESVRQTYATLKRSGCGDGYLYVYRNAYILEILRAQGAATTP
ncbi:MAG: hypothetical protein JO288_01650, partial [Hyphomicrobiales bacterium]|nr:hypothetical protein [Hyphomicrobiales bacterium]